MKARRNRVALYARVSTLEQSVDQQLTGLRREARARGWTVATTYADLESTRRTRVHLEELLAAAMRRQYDAIMVWRLDRLGRSVLELVGNVERLVDRGVAVVSVKDGALDTSTAAGKLQLAVLAAVAEYERELIRERTREGLQRVRARGVRLGRPPADPAKLEAAAAWLALERWQLQLPWSVNKSVREAARRHGIGATTLRRFLEARRKGVPIRREDPHSGNGRGPAVVRKGTV